MGWLLATRPDLYDGDVVRDSLRQLGSLPWPLVSLVVALPALASLHYLFSAVALRAASGRDLPLRETIYAQLAAAAANRVVPNGVGGAGVNVRFLRRFGDPAAAAVFTLGALSVVGGLTDGAYAAAVTSLGPSVGLSGAGQQFATLASNGIRAGSHMQWTLVAIGAVLLFVLVKRGVPSTVLAAGRGIRVAAQQFANLLRHPKRFGAMAMSSMACTAVLSLAFVWSVEAVGHGGRIPAVGALLAVYLVGTAVGGAAPVPAVFGVAEAALVAGLVTAGLPFHSALLATLVFRLVAFWLPLPAGIMAGKRLRAARLL
jgi:uncharacterized membrane protein YbhN (UPF0104 family)